MQAGDVDAGGRIAGIGAIVLVLAMLVLGWYSIDEVTVSAAGQSQTISADDIPGDVDNTGNAFQAFSIIDILLVIAALAALAAVAMRAAGNDKSGNAGLIAAAAGALAFILVLFRLIAVPDFLGNLGNAIPDGVDVDVEAGRGIGLFVGLISSAAMAYGGYAMMNTTGTSAPAASAPPAPPAQPPAA